MFVDLKRKNDQYPRSDRFQCRGVGRPRSAAEVTLIPFADSFSATAEYVSRVHGDEDLSKVTVVHFHAIEGEESVPYIILVSLPKDN